MFVKYYFQKMILQEKDKKFILQQIITQLENSNVESDSSNIEARIDNEFSALQNGDSKYLLYNDLVNLTIKKISEKIIFDSIEQTNQEKMILRDCTEPKISMFDYTIKTKTSFKFDSSNRF